MVVLDIALFATADAAWQRDIDEYSQAAKYHLTNFDMRPQPLPGQAGRSCDDIDRRPGA
jgi:hypothetical protein